MDILHQDELARALESVPGWKVDGNELIRAFQFSDFPAAMRFVNGAAAVAEELGHHPDLDIRHNKVRVALTTHDAGGLTSLDLQLAHRLDELESVGR